MKRKIDRVEALKIDNRDRWLWTVAKGLAKYTRK